MNEPNQIMHIMHVLTKDQNSINDKCTIDLRIQEPQMYKKIQMDINTTYVKLADNI